MRRKPAFGSVSLAGVTGVLGIFLVLQGTAGAQESRIVVFDAPGADTTAADFNGTFPGSINRAGVITGYYTDAVGTAHGFLRGPNGEYTGFDAPGADLKPGDYNGTVPESINDLGVVAGFYIDSNNFEHGFLRSPEGKFTAFEVPGASGYGTTPIAINPEGAVVGYYTDATYAFHAFLRRPDGAFATWVGPGECTGNGSQGCYGSGATNINAFGAVAGGYSDDSGNFVHHGFVRDVEGHLKTFDAPGAGAGTDQGTGCPGCAMGLSAFGAVAGNYIDANSVSHGYLRSPDGRFVTFDAPGAGTAAGQGTGCPSDCPTSLNESGAVMGSYIDANYTLHGYFRAPDGRTGTVDPAGTLYTWSSGMNDRGQITGYYLDGNYVYHGFVRVPD
jgi:hypothetical protein